MALTRKSRVKLIILAWVVGASVTGGAIFGSLLTDSLWAGLLRGGLTGLFISTPVVIAELYYFNSASGRWLRRLPIGRYLVIKCLVYAVSVVAGEALAGITVSSMTGVDSGPSATSLLYTGLFSAVAGLLVNFVMVIRLMLGDSALSHFFVGRYHQPREEERIFLFLDLVGSTAIAEKIGHTRFLDLLNRFIFDVTPHIIEAGGDIYRYVGDEVIATWPVGDAEANGRVVEAWASIRRRIDKIAPQYKREYGFDLNARAALHAGPVVVGELGDWKREIALLGDVVNTTARIEEACGDLGVDALMSSELREVVQMPSGVTAESVGERVMRGRAQPLELYSLRFGSTKAPTKTYGSTV